MQFRRRLAENNLGRKKDTAVESEGLCRAAVVLLKARALRRANPKCSSNGAQYVGQQNKIG